MADFERAYDLLQEMVSEDAGNITDRELYREINSTFDTVIREIESRMDDYLADAGITEDEFDDEWGPFREWAESEASTTFASFLYRIAKMYDDGGLIP